MGQFGKLYFLELSKKCRKNFKNGPTVWCFSKNFVKVQKTLQISWNIPQMPKSRATFWIFLPISPKSHYSKCILETLEFFKKLISFCVRSCPEWIHMKHISVHFSNICKSQWSPVLGVTKIECKKSQNCIYSSNLGDPPGEVSYWPVFR